GHRPRHPARRDAAAVPAVLHDQGGRRGHGPGPAAGAQDRRAEARREDHGVVPAGRYRVQGDAAHRAPPAGAGVDRGGRLGRRMETVRRLLSILIAACALTAAFGTASARSPDCGGLRRPIVFGDLDWESAQVANWIARLVLEEGFGCATDAIPGTVVPIYQGAVRGDVDVIMEVWTDNTPALWTEAVANGVVEEVGVAFDDAVQGWFVPRYLVEGDPARGIEPAAPGLRSVFDLAEHWELFRDPERPDKGRFYNCVIGWQCELVNTVKHHAYGLEDRFTNFRSGTGVALAAELEGAYRRGEPWVGYYWGPTWVLGELDLYLLEEPPFDPDCWAEFTALVDAPERATRACAYPTSRAVVALG